MYRQLDDFFADFKYESEGTLKLFKLLTDECLNVKLHPRVRTAGFLAWHITQTVKEMMEKTGLQIEGPTLDDYSGQSVQQIYEAYDKASKSLVQELKRKWTDETLKVEDNMYGMNWSRGTTLDILIKHQTHHRGQLEIVMRLNNLRVTSVYGPAYEEWEAMGMQPME